MGSDTVGSLITTEGGGAVGGVGEVGDPPIVILFPYTLILIAGLFVTKMRQGR